MFKFILFFLIAISEAEDVLKVLVTSPQTGYRITGISCLKAMQVAVDAANEKKDFLKGFKVEIEPGDDGFGPLGVTAVGNFYRDFIESRQPNETSYPAPIATGFLTTLNCQTVAPIMPHINMAMVAVGCSAPIFAEEKERYRNMFRIARGVEMSIGPIADFMKSFSWDKVALLFYQNDILVYNLANEFMKVAPDYNVSVVWSNNVNSIDENVADSLKQSKARVIFFTNPEIHLTTILMCQLYRKGFFNSNYIFLALTTTFYEVEFMTPRVPGGCTKQELLTIYKSVLFIGSKPFTVDNLGNVSYLGYDFDHFNRRYDEMMVNERKDPFHIQKCHDSILETMIALHESNEQLISRKNMTLRDYLVNPEEVIDQVKNSLAKTSFKGIRLERYYYSDRGEFDDEPLIVMQWTQGGRWKFPFDGVYDEKTRKYSTKQLSPIQWITNDGNPPKGWPNIVKTPYDIHLGFFIAICIVGILLTPVQGFLLTPSRQFLQLIGLIFLNLSCVIIAIPTTLTSDLLPICYTRMVTLAIGFVITSISLFLESISIWNLLKNRKRKPKGTKAKTICKQSYSIKILFQLLFFLQRQLNRLLCQELGQGPTPIYSS